MIHQIVRNQMKVSRGKVETKRKNKNQNKLEQMLNKTEITENCVEHTVIDLWFQFNDAVEGRGRECRREIIALYYNSSNIYNIYSFCFKVYFLLMNSNNNVYYKYKFD